jgi:hypothetical protein
MEIVKSYYQRHYQNIEEFKSLLDLILIPEFFNMVKDSDDFSEATIDDFITICLDYIEDIIERSYYNFYTFYDLESKRKITNLLTECFDDDLDKTNCYFEYYLSEEDYEYISEIITTKLKEFNININ